MCIKAVDRFFFVFKSVADSYKTQEICDKIIPNAPFVLKSCLGGHRTQERCDEVVDDFLPALKFVSDWFLTDKMIKKFITFYSQMMAYPFLMKILVISHF